MARPSRPTLAAWQTAVFTDQNSLAHDPRFVNLVGADRRVGYVDAARDGRDDDFHLMSRYDSGSCHDGAVRPSARLRDGSTGSTDRHVER